MSRSSEVSAGVLAFRRKASGKLELLLAHPGGPYWRGRDEGAWSIPKGVVESGDPIACAKREFNEETGLTADGPLVALTPARQKSGKLVHAFALEADFDLGGFSSNEFEMEWPPRPASGKAFPRSTASPISIWPPRGARSCPASAPSSRNWWSVYEKKRHPEPGLAKGFEPGSGWRSSEGPSYAPTSDRVSR